MRNKTTTNINDEKRNSTNKNKSMNSFWFICFSLLLKSIFFFVALIFFAVFCFRCVDHRLEYIRKQKKKQNLCRIYFSYIIKPRREKKTRWQNKANNFELSKTLKCHENNKKTRSNTQYDVDRFFEYRKDTHIFDCIVVGYFTRCTRYLSSWYSYWIEVISE